MQPTTNSLILAARKASKFLLRDFFELEMLQSSTRGTIGFCSQAFAKTKSLLKAELEKNYKYLVFSDEIFNIPQKAESILLVQPIDAIENLSKSLNFFSLSITYLKKINDIFVATNSIMLFPATYELYYAEKGSGAWCEKNSLDIKSKIERLRLSNHSNLEEAIIACNKVNQNYSNIRITGSLCYDIGLLVSGKLDAVHCEDLNPILQPGFELFVKESGGFFVNSKKAFIASNQKLLEKINQYSI